MPVTVVGTTTFRCLLAVTMEKSLCQRSFHHFRLSSKYPRGEVYCYTHLNDPDPVKFNLLKKDVENVSSKLPPIVQSNGLSEERIRYLYNDIREFCSHENKDMTAPAPK